MKCQIHHYLLFWRHVSSIRLPRESDLCPCAFHKYRVLKVGNAQWIILRAQGLYGCIWITNSINLLLDPQFTCLLLLMFSLFISSQKIEFFIFYLWFSFSRDAVLSGNYCWVSCTASRTHENAEAVFKGIIHPKVKILLLFIHPKCRSKPIRPLSFKGELCRGFFYAGTMQTMQEVFSHPPQLPAPDPNELLTNCFTALHTYTI